MGELARSREYQLQTTHSSLVPERVLFGFHEKQDLQFTHFNKTRCVSVQQQPRVAAAPQNSTGLFWKLLGSEIPKFEISVYLKFMFHFFIFVGNFDVGDS